MSVLDTKLLNKLQIGMISSVSTY